MWCRHTLKGVMDTFLSFLVHSAVIGRLKGDFDTIISQKIIILSSHSTLFAMLKQLILLSK